LGFLGFGVIIIGLGTSKNTMKRYLFNLATDKSKGFIAEGIKVFLFLLSLLYGLIVRILIWIRQIRTYQSECKVISIGNITLGGTGKTVVVEYIARYLTNKGKKVAILSRGYKRRVVTTSQSHPVTSYEMLGDEPYMLSRNLGDIPIIVNSDRIKAAKYAINDFKVDTVLLDDGFQQWHIKKDLEVVTIDSTNPFGNRHMIPRGILREPLSFLRRADVFILTKTNLAIGVKNILDFLSRINPRALILESVHNPAGFYKLGLNDGLLDANVLKDKVVTLISGIGDPDSFESLIRSMGIEIGLSFRFG
jgi:tetraacyldisaccharide 4'-kinase